MKKVILFVFGTLVWSFAIQSCESTNEPDSGVNVGTLQLKITDAPFPFDIVEEANVTINKIEVRNKLESEDDAFVIVYEDEIELNLLNLRNGVTENLPKALLGIGSYDLVRLYISDANVLLKDATIHNLKVPSGAQTGIKIFIEPPIEIKASLSSDLLIDFDLSESFVLQGNMDSQNGFIFKPTIRAANLSTSGTVYGIITDEGSNPLPDSEVIISNNDNELYTVAGENGNYEIMGVPTGIYSISVSAEGFIESSVSDVEIFTANMVEQNFILED